jgi:hypothetical protein
MRAYTKIALLAVSSILLILSTACASEYAFGTKVLLTDKDMGKPLFAMPDGTTVAFWDTGVVPGYDENDVVYLHTSTATTVNSNDIRLTPFGDFPAGSKVTPYDNDIGMPLTSLPASIRYLNIYGSVNYNLGDPVYIHQNLPCLNPPSAFATITNDVRLTEVRGLIPGTKVRDFDPDQNKLFGLIPTNLEPIGFFDANGNGVYDYPDDVYLNFPFGVQPGIVAVNNVRLSGPIYSPMITLPVADNLSKEEC